MTIIALEGVRGTGKTTIWKELQEKYEGQCLFDTFPTLASKHRLSHEKYDMTKLDDIIKYNMIFVEDFITETEFLNTDELIILDRYILSSLAHFKYDVYDMDQGHAYEWSGMSRILYHMFDNHLVLKPDMIIYLQGDHRQPEDKFDDYLYKGKEDQLKWFYDTELSALKNNLGIQFTMVESLKPNTFEMVDSIIKRYI